MNKRITKIEDAAATVDKLAGELLTPADHFYKLRTYDCGVGEIMRSLHEDTQRMFLHLMDLFRLDRELKHKNEKPDPKTKNLAWYLECEFKDLIALSRLPELHAATYKGSATPQGLSVRSRCTSRRNRTIFT